MKLFSYVIQKFKFSRIFVRNNNIKYALILFCSSIVFLTLRLKEKTIITHLIHYNINLTDGIKCYYTVAQDDLPIADGRNFSPPANSIFFHETSCKGDLDSRQACSVESAARAHPGWQINVLFPGPANNLSLKGGTLLKLSKFNNVKLRRIYISEYSKQTPIEPVEYILASYNTLPSVKSVQQAGDILKYVTLYKWGGIYLDLDVIVLKPLDGLGNNWAVRQDDDLVCSGMISLSRSQVGRNISKIALKYLQNFKPASWHHNSSRVFTRALQQTCSTNDVTQMIPDTCNGFQVYGPENFYPIPYTRWKTYFEKGEVTMDGDHAFTQHIWNHFTREVRVPKNSLYASLAKTYCPTIYEMFGDEFGI